MSVATQTVKKFEVRGAVADIFKCRDKQVLIHGPAGTGKSRGIIEKAHLALTKYPGARGLMVRKTRSSLTNTGIVTFEKEVLSSGDHVDFHTPSQSYKYANNGSALVVGGLDDPSKVMSSQYDIIIGLEATEYEEDDLEALITRLRNGVMPYQQIILDCNPAPPSHWLWRRALSGLITSFASKHEDNPRFYDLKNKKWTVEGEEYVNNTLKNLTGIRYKRLYLGQWSSAEGMVYENWDANIHIVPRFDIPLSWNRYLVVDFGYTHPFVAQYWAEDPDGRLYRYREIYRTQRTVAQHCMTIRALNEPRPKAIICDHDAEDRATLESELKMGTIPANKSITTGIQAMTDRLRIAGDGKPRIFYLKDSTVEIDKNLSIKKLPYCNEDEFDSYVWDTSTEKKMELPIKKYDHGMDASRYICMHLDARLRSKPRIVALT